MKWEKADLEFMYRRLKTTPGWLSSLKDEFFDKEDLNYLNFVIEKDCTWQIQEAIAKRKNIDYYKKFEDLKKEVEEDETGFTETARLNFLEQRISLLEKKISKVTSIYEQMSKLNGDARKRIIFGNIGNLAGIVEEINKCNSERNNITRVDTKEEKITEYDILKAKQYPIEKLLDINTKRFALCPFHDDKRPSLYCKDNFYHCFSCGETGDVIDLFMRLEGYTFVEAVRILKK